MSCDGQLTQEQIAMVIGALVILSNAISAYLVVATRRRDAERNHPQ